MSTETVGRTNRSAEELSKCRKCFNFICGIEQQDEKNNMEVKTKTEEENAIEAAEFLNESSKVKRCYSSYFRVFIDLSISMFIFRLTNVMAVLIMCLAAFIYGFFA